jgi:hypothetical protein
MIQSVPLILLRICGRQRYVINPDQCKKLARPKPGGYMMLASTHWTIHWRILCIFRSS